MVRHTAGGVPQSAGRSRLPVASPDRCTHLLTVRPDRDGPLCDATGGPVVFPSGLHSFPEDWGLSTDPSSRRSPSWTRSSSFGPRVKGCPWSHCTGRCPANTDFLAAVSSISVPQNHGRSGHQLQLFKLGPAAVKGFLPWVIRPPRPLGTLSGVCSCFWLSSPPKGLLARGGWRPGMQWGARLPTSESRPSPGVNSGESETS